MSEHTHLIEYTILSVPFVWWKWLFGLTDKRTYTGIRSSQQGGELLIFLESGGLHSINYSRVLSMTAEPLEHSHAPETDQLVDSYIDRKRWEAQGA